MLTLQIEHPIRDFDTWKAAFERDPAGRQQAGTRRHQILRPIDNPNYIIIHLDFESHNEAEAFVARMQGIWKSASATPALAGAPQTRILETIESKEYLFASVK